MIATPAREAESANTAVACAELVALLPAGVAAAHLHEGPPKESLLPAEAQCTRQWSPKRWQDFTAGRVCARRALEQFNQGEFPLRAGADGLPIWPAGLTGCITHANGYAAAVAGPLSIVGGLGVDSEVIRTVDEEVWAFICTPDEHTALHAMEPERRAQRAALTFVAKEAFYKSQYPLTGEWIEFGEVTVAIRASLSLTGEFEIRPRRPLLVQRRSEAPLLGRYRIHGPFITAVMALPPSN